MKADQIINRLLEDEAPEDMDAFFRRALTELPDKHTGMTSPTAPGDDWTAPLRVVLHHSHAFRPGFEEWVTHLENMQVGGKMYGHYTTNYDDALADYKERCAKLRVDWQQSTLTED
jgi:hypothetical protein